MAALGVTPLPKLLGQGVLLLGERLGLEALEALMDQVEGLIDQLGRLLGGHGMAHDDWSRGITEPRSS